jgi:hypothetical protein
LNWIVSWAGDRPSGWYFRETVQRRMIDGQNV